MTEKELIEGLTYLGVAFGKEYSEVEARIYYEQLKDYPSEIFIETIKKLVQKNKFLPKIAEIIEIMEDKKTAIQLPIIDYMKECGYFKKPMADELQAEREELHNYEKAKMWVVSGNIPEWFLKDMREFYNKSLKLGTTKLLN